MVLGCRRPRNLHISSHSLANRRMADFDPKLPLSRRHLKPLSLPALWDHGPIASYGDGVGAQRRPITTVYPPPPHYHTSEVKLG
jgi:hypothetical protein